jgi:hypothetical protein
MSLASRLAQYWSLTRKRAAEGHLSVTRQLLEMCALLLISGNGPGLYHLAGFWRRSVPFREKCAHLSAGGYRRRLRRLNPPEYRKITQNKLPEKGLLNLLGFPTPEFVGFLCPQIGRCHDGQPLRDAEDLARLIRRLADSRLCFKPVEGWGGKGFELVEIVRDEPMRFRLVRDGRAVDVRTFVSTILSRNKVFGVLIEKYLEQHPDMAQFNPSSVNTCRVWVARPCDAAARVLLAYLRIGRAGSPVDNQSSGGIVAPIDLQTGAVSAAIDGLPTRAVFPRHPDHGARIEGGVIPSWSEVKALAESCLAAIPRLRFAGLDIAVGRAGPIVIELNAIPDREGAAFVGVPTGPALPRT